MAEKPQDFNLPQNIVAKLIKDSVSNHILYSFFALIPRVVLSPLGHDSDPITNWWLQLPNDVQVSKDARAVLGKAASIFVLYSTAYASKIAEQNGRKNLTAQDVVEATDHLGFGDFVQEMKQVYQVNKRDKARQNKARQEKRHEKKQSSLLAKGDPQEDEDEDGDEDEESEEPSYEVVFE